MSFSPVFILLLGFLFSALFSGVETGSYMINRIRLRQRELERHRSAIRLSKLLANPHIFIFTVLIGNNLAIYFLSKAVTGFYLGGGLESRHTLFGFIPWSAEMAATLTLVFPLFFFAEVAPKNLFRKKADKLMYRLSGLMRLIVLVFYPFTWPLKKFFNLLSRGVNEEPRRELHRLSPDGLKDYFSAGAKEGVISSQQSRMVDNATSMHDVPVRMLMTPIKAISRLPAEATVADFKRLVARRNSTYALLMQNHAVIGIVSMFAIVNRNLGNDDLLRPCANEVLEIQENRSLKSTFYRLRRNSQHSAVILDARGHPIGLIRLEDIARYIAGE